MTSQYLNTIDTIQLEISNFCNADCFHCVRTETNSNYLNSKFLPRSIFEDLLRDPLGAQIKKLEFCGTIDEPFAHPNFLEIIDTIYCYNPLIEINIHTNGSVRNTDFYRELAHILSKFENRHTVRFSIDGLQESHYLYRGLKNYQTILENAQTFIQEGGVAVWQLVEFPWNCGEIERCRHLAKLYGFDRFIARRNRGAAIIDNPRQYRTERETRDQSELIQPYQPLPEYTQTEIQKRQEIVSRTLDDQINIECHFRQERKMFLDHQGYIWPCCFLANPSWRTQADRIEIREKLSRRWGESFNSMYEHSLSEILGSEWFQSELVNSWQEPYSITTGCFAKCIKTCNNNRARVEHHITTL